MRDFPNMSHCMCQNTLGAVRQITNAMSDHNSTEGFLNELSREERRAFFELVNEMRLLVEVMDDSEEMP
jgi:hypothetical protein